MRDGAEVQAQDLRNRHAGDTALALGQLLRGRADPFTGRVIIEQTRDSRRKILRAGDLNHGVTGTELAGYSREILHVRANDHGRSEESGLQNVVPAATRESSAHKHDRSGTEQRAQFTDGIEEKNAGKRDALIAG